MNNKADERKTLIRHKDTFFHQKGDKILQQFPWEDVESSSLEIFRMKLIKALNSLLQVGMSLRGAWTRWHPAVASHLNYWFILGINADICSGSVGKEIVKYLSQLQSKFSFGVFLICYSGSWCVASDAFTSPSKKSAICLILFQVPDCKP